MRQDISKSIIPTPLTLTHCFEDGCINISRYVHYRQKLDDDIAQNQSISNSLNCKRKMSQADAPISRSRKKRSVKTYTT